MTFKQIEEEFDETFVNTLYSTQSDVQVNVWKLIDYGNGEHKIGHYYGPDEIKSFLKQSFIKYLQGEVEKCKSKQEYYWEQSRINLNENNVMLAYDMDSRSVAMKHYIETLQAQIKELEK